MDIRNALTLFAHPVLLTGLAVVPVLGVLGFMALRRRRALFSRIGPAYALQPLIEHPRRRGGAVAIGLGLTLLSVGAAGPRWGSGPPPAVAPGRDIVVVLDLSRSMLARDALPDRLGKAKAAIGELTEAVQTRGGHRLAVVAFAGRAHVVCPLTHDYEAIRTKISALEADPPPMPVRAAGGVASGTRMGTGLREAIALLDPKERGAQDVVLFTDGDDPAGDEEWRAGAAEARAAGVPVHVVGLGDPDRDSPIPTTRGHLQFQGSEVRTRLHEDSLREMARRTSGTYIAARTDRPPMADYFRTAIAPGPTREAVAGTLPQPPGQQALFFAGALTLLTLHRPVAGTWGVVKRLAARVWSRNGKPALAIVIVALVGAAPAVDEALRRGNASVVAGKPEEALIHFARAAERTTDPGQVAFNQGVALARLGRYREAELHFRRSLSDATGDRRRRAEYNLGCCLLQESRGRLVRPLRQAVACFERALELSDAELLPDLLHNLELAKRLLLAARAASPNQPEPPDGELDAPPKPSGLDPSSPAMPGPDRATTLGPGDTSPKAFAKANDPGTPRPADQPSPGKGNLPPLPDNDALVSLTPEDALAHLERAAVRIGADRQARLRQTAPAPSQQYPEW